MQEPSQMIRQLTEMPKQPQASSSAQLSFYQLAVQTTTIIRPFPPIHYSISNAPRLRNVGRLSFLNQRLRFMPTDECLTSSSHRVFVLLSHTQRIVHRNSSLLRLRDGLVPDFFSLCLFSGARSRPASTSLLIICLQRSTNASSTFALRLALVS